MRLVHVDRAGAALSEESGRLVVRADGERIATLPLKTIDRIVVTAHAALATALLVRLLEQGTGVLVAPEAFRRFEPLHVVPARADARRRLLQYAAAANPRAAARIAAGIVRLRLTGQAGVLRELAGDGRLPAARADEAVAAIATMAGRIGGRDETGQIRGAEGAGAAAFFGAFRAAFPAALAFEARRRRPPPDPVNVCLSLGYTLAHHEALHALSETGLDVACGFLHEPLAGRDSLACDVTEPLRAIVERFVAGLFRADGLRPDHFSVKDGACMMGKAGRRLFYERHAAEAAPRLREVARSTAAWLLRELGADAAAAHALGAGETPHGR